MQKPKSVPLVFTDAHYAALGRVVVEFQSLEQALTFALAQFIHPEEAIPLNPLTHMVLNELSFANKAKLLSAYANTHLANHIEPGAHVPDDLWLKDFQEELETLRQAIRLATEAEAGRNQMVHSHWLTRPVAGPEGTVLRTKFRTSAKKVSVSSEYITPEQISLIWESAKQAATRIQSPASSLYFMAKEVAGASKSDTY